MIRTNPELLQYIEQFQSQANDEIISIRKLAPGESIICQGKKSHSVYIIISGIVKCYQTEENAKDFIQEFFGEGEICGEIEALNGAPAFCYIETITCTDVYQISNQHFNKLLENNKKFNQQILKAVASKISYKAPRHAYHQSHAIEDNLMRLQKQFPELIETISKQDIANYLGVTIRSLNRTLKTLKEQGMLS